MGNSRSKSSTPVSSATNHTSNSASSSSFVKSQAPTPPGNVSYSIGTTPAYGSRVTSASSSRVNSASTTGVTSLSSYSRAPSSSLRPSSTIISPTPSINNTVVKSFPKHAREASSIAIFGANNYVIPNNAAVATTEFIPNICVPFRSKVDKFPMRVCPQYNSFKGCNVKPCYRFHICQFWMKGDCRKNDCTNAHSFNDRHNLALLQPHVRRNFGEGQLLDVLRKGSFVGKSKIGYTGGYICIGYLHKKCTMSNCNYHHLTSTFMWEICIGDSWERFTPKQNDELEKSFCDPKNVTLVLSKLPQLNNKTKPSLLHQALGENCCTVNFENLSLISSNSFFRIRRLSTPSDIQNCHSSATRWLWHWQDDSDQWSAYASGTINDYYVIPLSDHLEYLFLKNTKEVNVTVNQTVYQLNFDTMTQVNNSSGIVRLMRRRPMQLAIREKFNSNSTFRNIWTKTAADSVKFERVTVSSTSPEHSFISNMLLKTLPTITDIIVQRIENPFLWESYQLKKKQYLDKYRLDTDKVNEQYLFHGTTYSVIDKICSDGFDWRLFGTSVGYVYGQGTYFSNEASLSNAYASENDDGYKSMFIALVLVGISTLGDKSMTRPPKNIFNNNKRFDTTVNDQSGSKIFVKYDLDEHYPAYYVKYKV